MNDSTWQVIDGGRRPAVENLNSPEGFEWVTGVLDDLGKAMEEAGFTEAAREIHVTRLRVTALISMRM